MEFERYGEICAQSVEDHYIRWRFDGADDEDIYTYILRSWEFILHLKAIYDTAKFEFAMVVRYQTFIPSDNGIFDAIVDEPELFEPYCLYMLINRYLLDRFTHVQYFDVIKIYSLFVTLYF